MFVENLLKIANRFRVSDLANRHFRPGPMKFIMDYVDINLSKFEHLLVEEYCEVIFPTLFD